MLSSFVISGYLAKVGLLLFVTVFPLYSLTCRHWVVWLQQDREIVPGFPRHFCFKEIIMLNEKVLFLNIKTVKQREDFM